MLKDRKWLKYILLEIVLSSSTVVLLMAFLIIDFARLANLEDPCSPSSADNPEKAAGQASATDKQWLLKIEQHIRQTVMVLALIFILMSYYAKRIARILEIHARSLSQI